MSDVLVIGLGNMGRRRANTLRRFGYAVRTVDPAAPADYARLADVPEVPEAVIISTPPATHVPLLLKVLSRGARRVFVEKPLTEPRMLDPGLLDVLRGYDAEVCVGANWRYAYAYRLVRELIRGLPGWDEVSLSAQADVTRWPAASYERRLLSEMYPHMLYILEFVTGLQAVGVERYRWKCNGETALYVLLALEHGKRAWLHAQWSEEVAVDTVTLNVLGYPQASFHLDVREGPATIARETVAWISGSPAGLPVEQALRHMRLLALIDDV